MPTGKILVADSEQIIRVLLTRALDKEGYEVVTARDEDEVSNIFIKGDFNLVMMEARLPGVDGIKVLARLKEIDPDIEGTVITGYDLLQSAAKGLKNEGIEYIIKPFDKIEDVVGVVNRLVKKQKVILENKRLQKEIRRQRDELKKRVFELGVLYDISDAIGYSLDYKQLFELIMASLSKVLDYDVCASFVVTEKSGDLVVKAARAVTKDFVEEVKKNMLESISSSTGQRIDEKNIIVNSDSIPAPARGEKALTKVGSFFNIHLVVKGKPIGMLNVSSSRKNAFSSADIKILYTISNQAAVAIEKLKGVITTEKSKMEAMVESMTEGLVMMDGKKRPIVCNPSARRMFDLRKDQLNKTCWEACFEKTGLDETYQEIMSGEKKVATKEITLEGELAQIVLRSDMAPVKDIDGKSLGMVVVFRNITAEKEVDLMKTEFISTVSHELRTPLTTMREFIAIILDEIPGKINKDQKEYLSIIKGNIDRLARIIRSLLDISKIEARRIELRKASTNLIKLVKDTITTLKSRADAKRITIETLFPHALSDVFVDLDRIIQVFTNLIDNAIKFTPEGGKITVEIKTEKKEITCSVTDSGVGIAPEDRDKVFERFRQIGRTAGAGAKGTGLGLPITKALIEMHKGRIWIEGDVGKGSKFAFTIPKLDSDEIFMEYLSNGLRIAKDKHTVLSLIVIEMANFDDIKKEHGTKGAHQILDELEGIAKNNARLPADIVTRYRYKKGRWITILSEVNRQNSQVIRSRIEKAIQAHKFWIGETTIKVNLAYGIATYPDEALCESELIEMAEKGLKIED